MITRTRRNASAAARTTARAPEPITPNPALPDFTPVPRRDARFDGWTPERQIGFINALADLGSVRAAANSVRMTPEGAYQLRRHPQAASFNAAWAAALAIGVHNLEDIAMDRALNGTQEDVFYKGEKIGTRTVYNDRLLMFILRNRAPDRFAADSVTNASASTQSHLDRLKREWRAQWEEEQAILQAKESEGALDSLNAKLDLMRTRHQEAKRRNAAEKRAARAEAKAAKAQSTPAPTPANPTPANPTHAAQPTATPAPPDPTIRILDDLLTHGNKALCLPRPAPKDRLRALIGTSNLTAPSEVLSGDQQAVAEWERHLDAGRIGERKNQGG